MTYQGPEEPEGGSPHDPGPYVDHDLDGPNNTDRDPWTVILGIIGGTLLGAGLTLGVLGATGVFNEPAPPTTSTIPPPPTLTVPAPNGTRPALPGDDPTAADVAARTIPSIVAVGSTSVLGESSGSGVVYGTDGYIITNHHVVEGGDDFIVAFSDGATYPADLIGSDELTDLAVLRVSRPDLAPIDLGTSGDLDVGAVAIAVGNPLALTGGPSVTSGIISALNRSLDIDGATTLYGLIQTDAPITRGSSGGALLDGTSRLIGITTAIAVSDVGAEGLGFAIPIDMVIDVVDDLIESGEVEHAFLGITGSTAFAREDGAQYPAGVLVEDIVRDGPYQTAGGQINDVIVSIDDTSVTTLNEMLTTLRSHRAGEEIDLRVRRGDSELALAVILGRLET
jgi:S1-C subfamily serine protease